MPVPLLDGKQLAVDRRRVGISYSGGGPLLLVELGIARAFVELGIRPNAIAGASAGSITAVAHALDPVNGTGVRAAAIGLERVSNSMLGLTLPRIVWRVLRERQRLVALGDNAPIRVVLAEEFQSLTHSTQLNVGDFGHDGRPKLVIGAADRLSGDPAFFESGSIDVADALVASSAIPGFFPPKHMEIDQVDRLFVDGGVVDNQPLSVLALQGCGTVYACAVGYDGQRLAAPNNLIDNWSQSISMTMHQASRLEQAYVQERMGDQGVIHHIHPEVPFPVQGFNFTPDLIAQVMRDASDATKTWITTKGIMPDNNDARS